MTAAFAVDFSRPIGRIRPLHGGNNGPLYHGGIVDLTPQHRRLRIPLVRLHDCDWPGDYLVDIHAVFPDPAADPEDPASYDFANTDDYIARIVALGSQIVYRLGCRIEHTRRRRHTTPPADPQRWARICLGIIRHCNHGWADGHHWDIRHWEVWNEPDIPPGCWSGTWDDYFRLYATAATAIKTEFPGVRVGGPAYAVGIAGRATRDEQAFARAFLGFCREHRLPLDFFSWHTYAPGDLTLWEERSRLYRALLDEHGYGATESHLNEWHVLPPHGSHGPSWHFAETLQGPVGASAIAASLVCFQDLPIDQACLYSMDPAACYGMFTMGSKPQPSYFAVAAFAELLDTSCRVAATGTDPARGLAVLAGLAEDRACARVLLANYVQCPQVRFPLRIAALPWSGPTAMSIRRVDAEHELTESERQVLPAGKATVDLALPPASVVLLELRPAPAGAQPGAVQEVDPLLPLRLEQPRLSIADGMAVLAVPVVNRTATMVEASIAPTLVPQGLSVPTWDGSLRTGGDGLTTCLLPLAGDAPGDPDLRLALRAEGRTWTAAAQVHLARSGTPLRLDGWAELTPLLDADAFRLLAAVRDDAVHDHRDLGLPPHQGACVELFCDWDRPGDLGRHGFDADDMQIVCTPPGRADQPPHLCVYGSHAFAPADLPYRAERGADGWSLELVIPWRLIGAVGGRRGLPVALALAVRACGADGGERRLARWAGDAGSWCDTRGFGLVLP